VSEASPPGERRPGRSGKIRACLICGARGPGVLARADLCRDHLTMLQGRSPLEAHHPEGRANSIETVLLPVSTHASLTAKQARWPDVLKYPSNDPAIRIARRSRVLRDLLTWYLQASERDSDWLVALALAQQEQHGDEWWESSQVAPLNPKGAADE